MDDLDAAVDAADEILVSVRCFGGDHGGGEGRAEYNQLASIMLSNQHHVIQALFARQAAGVLFTPNALLLSLILVFCLSMVVYGGAFPSGIFVPCMTIGALFGRLVGELHAASNPAAYSADAGFYALVGAAAFLGGVTRMTISLTVIVCEISNDASSLLPLMAATFTARVVGDLFNASLFDTAMGLAGYPYLEPTPERRFSALCAEDAMTASVVTLAEVETAERIAHVLSTTQHAAFPVVEVGSSRKCKFLTGSIARYQLELLLRKRAFLPPPGPSLSSAEGHHTHLPSSVRSPPPSPASGEEGEGGGGGARIGDGLWPSEDDGSAFGDVPPADFNVPPEGFMSPPPVPPPPPPPPRSPPPPPPPPPPPSSQQRVPKPAELEIDVTRKSPSPNAASNSAPATPTGRNSGTPTSFADAAANGEEEAEAPSPHEKRTRAFLQQHHHQRRRQQQQEQAAASSDGQGSDGGLGGGFDGRGHQGIRIAELVVAREASRVADAAAKQAAAAGLAASLLHEGDASRRIDLRPVMELSPHAVLHSMPLPRLHEMFVTQGLRHLYVTDTRNQVVGCITRKDLLPEVLEANNEVYDETAGKSGEGGEHHTPAPVTKREDPHGARASPRGCVRRWRRMSTGMRAARASSDARSTACPPRSSTRSRGCRTEAKMSMRAARRAAGRGT